MALFSALNAAKLASQHFAFRSAWSDLTGTVIQPVGLPSGRSSEPQRQNLSDADILECSWEAASPKQPETSLSETSFSKISLGRQWQSGGRQDAAGIRQRSVLIIDDNDDSLLFAQYAVEHLGYRTTVLKSGHGAAATAMTCLPDIILLDILLEHISGIDVLRQLRKHEAIAQVPTIAVTALARPCDHTDIMASGFSDYLLKPYMIDDLRRMLNRHLST